MRIYRGCCVKRVRERRLWGTQSVPRAESIKNQSGLLDHCGRVKAREPLLQSLLTVGVGESASASTRAGNLELMVSYTESGSSNLHPGGSAAQRPHGHQQQRHSAHVSHSTAPGLHGLFTYRPAPAPSGSAPKPGPRAHRLIPFSVHA